LEIKKTVRDLPDSARQRVPTTETVSVDVRKLLDRSALERRLNHKFSTIVDAFAPMLINPRGVV